MIERRRLLAATALASLVPPGTALAQSELSALERVRKRGILVVAVYEDHPPFHVAGKGIDAEIAAALAEGLGVKLSLLAMRADEKLDDDLRHAVWKGHLDFGFSYTKKKKNVRLPYLILKIFCKLHLHSGPSSRLLWLQTLHPKLGFVV